MGRITELRLQDVRCFEQEQRARMGRITLLVGPNGAGKSTFLGCYRALSKLGDMDDLNDANHFDDPPFRLGAFDDIARTGCDVFGIAGSFEGHCHTGAEYSFVAGRHGMPVEHRVRLRFSGAGSAERCLEIAREPGNREILRIEGPDFRFDLDRSIISYIQTSTWLSRYARHSYLPYSGDIKTFSHGRHFGERASESDVVSFGKFITFFRSGLPLPAEPSLIVEAPEPRPPARQRLYDAVPGVLEGFDEETRKFMADFGTTLKLWDDIRVRRDDEGRVEVLVGTPNGLRNLLDVGYGVTSLLPLVRVIHKRPGGTTFLLQQPEGQLHPEAQADLAELMVASNHHFVIETHSDHFLNRFLICVMEKRLTPENLSIVYFKPAPDRTRSTIHNIRVDADGNLLDIPDGYRDFFMREDARLLGFDT